MIELRRYLVLRGFSLSAPNQLVSIHEKLSQSLDSDWSFCFSVPDPGGPEANLISLHCWFNTFPGSQVHKRPLGHAAFSSPPPSMSIAILPTHAYGSLALTLPAHAPASGPDSTLCSLRLEHLPSLWLTDSS